MEPDTASLTTQVKAIHDSLRAAVEKLGEEAKANQGAATEATGKLVKDLGDSFQAATAELKAKQEEIAAELKNERERIDLLDAKSKRPGSQYATAVDSKSLAAMVVEHENYKSYVKSGGPRNSEKIPVPGGFYGRKTFGLTSTTGDLVQPLRIDLVAPQLRPLLIRDLMPVRPLDRESVSYLEETAFAAVLGTAAITSITRSSQTATVTTTAAHGLINGDLVRVSGAAQTEYNIDAYVTVTSPTVFTYTVAGSPASGSGTMLFMKLNGQGAAGYAAEGTLKPEALLELIERKADAAVIAHFLKITKQAAEDAPSVVSYIEDRLIYALAFKEESQILYGPGTAGTLQGIMTHPRVQTYSWSAGTVGDTKVDAVRRAMTLSHIREFVPTAGVLNPIDKADIDLAKGSDDHYLWVATPDGRLWGLNLVVTNAMQPAEFLVGAFASGGVALWDREAANVQIATQNDTDFVENKRTLLAEERIALTISRPQAFTAGSFDAEPSA